MASLRELRRRIKSVQNIHGITKAMEIISAVRFKKLEVRLRKALPYYENLDRLAGRIVSDALCANHPLFQANKSNKELVLVVTGSRGLCGSFNSQILKNLQKYLNENTGREIELFPIGKVGAGWIKKRNLPVYDHWNDFNQNFTSQEADPVIGKLVDAFLSGEFATIKILSTEMPRPSVFNQDIRQFLSLTHLMERSGEDTKELDYIFEPDRQKTFEKLIQLYVKQSFFMSLLHSVTAEFFARMIAMKQATDNGKEMIENLILVRNKVRQAMITTEISEIIGGANALE